MSSWDQMVDELSTDQALSDLTDAQIEAVIDVLCLVVYADQRVTILEKNELEDQLRELPFMAKKAAVVDAYLEKALEQAKAADQDAAFNGIAANAARQITGAGARMKVFRMAATLACADLELHAKESRALDHLARAFGIDSAEAKRVVEAAL